ncbi:hypothetical protein A3K29_04675 [Candidatus Collierbacteria bacterium RIFOXYB2_FULL_46_14]|nr:MAG: hypothetical protein A3K29_04675 [Candidatus Collierbacteria bacterium RIFOXYB2_FULL_46_14]OGD76435.1 MAG: hypothetical protein A3K43_04675 [Candidatus Collierbacteria bacterium RIFOXYA2_FULL_46_20]OGD77771.1 MAG: hypothetical protein A3K39_04675 [Candidatus Collierbacteria bacterium RIFOXYC2_FULL_43_15]OGD81061.1 MAG: hypothetical protein A2320_05170 [Pseudomonadales bacterium GWC2_63_15]OGD82493.1 MAG: hypothetical protein A3K36_04675 [Candidatus Collierbacteria bacterium RIFOXYD2_FUL
MKQNLKSTFRTMLGIFLIVFGVAGMILPVLPGWWVALIGLQILGWTLVVDRHKPWRQIFSFKHKLRDRD